MLSQGFFQDQSQLVEVLWIDHNIDAPGKRGHVVHSPKVRAHKCNKDISPRCHGELVEITEYLIAFRGGVFERFIYDNKIIRMKADLFEGVLLRYSLCNVIVHAFQYGADLVFCSRVMFANKGCFSLGLRKIKGVFSRTISVRRDFLCRRMR